MTQDFKDVIDGLTRVIEEKMGAKSEEVEKLRKRFDALDAEKEHLDLPRIVFHHTRYKFAVVRQLIDRINEYGPKE